MIENQNLLPEPACSTFAAGFRRNLRDKPDRSRRPPFLITRQHFQKNIHTEWTILSA